MTCASVMGAHNNMTSDPRKTKHLHRVVIEDVWFETRLEYNPNTDYAYTRTQHKSKAQTAASGRKWRENHKERIDEVGRVWRSDNKESIAKYGKQYYEDNKDRRKVLASRYYEDNKEMFVQYYEDNKERIHTRQKQYRETHKEEIAARMKLYYRDNIKMIREWRRAHPTEKRTYVVDVGSCTHLNSYFDGCRRHHVDINTIIHIPKDMHIYHKHNIRTGEGMDVINSLAFEFLLQGEL